MSSEPRIDLRSDTVTRLRASHARGDGGRARGRRRIRRRSDGERAGAAHRRVARKESALFVPSGTMGNQLALLVQTRPGDEAVIGEGAHIAFYEAGAGAALAGVQFAQAGAGGLFDADELKRRGQTARGLSPPHLVGLLENTHNRAGGRVFLQATVEVVVKRARGHGLRAHWTGRACGTRR